MRLRLLWSTRPVHTVAAPVAWRSALLLLQREQQFAARDFPFVVLGAFEEDAESGSPGFAANKVTPSCSGVFRQASGAVSTREYLWGATRRRDFTALSSGGRVAGGGRPWPLSQIERVARMGVVAGLGRWWRASARRRSRRS